MVKAKCPRLYQRREVRLVALSITWSREDTSRPSLMDSPIDDAPIDDGLIRFPKLLLLVHYRVACTCVLGR